MAVWAVPSLPQAWAPQCPSLFCWGPTPGLHYDPTCTLGSTLPPSVAPLRAPGRSSEAQGRGLSRTSGPRKTRVSSKLCLGGTEVPRPPGGPQGRRTLLQSARVGPKRACPVFPASVSTAWGGDTPLWGAGCGGMGLAGGASPDKAWQGGLPSPSSELPARNSRFGFRRNSSPGLPGLLLRA